MRLSGGAMLLALFGLTLPGAGVPAAADAPGSAPSDLAIEGISLGQSFEEVDGRFDLSDLEPLEVDGALRYTWRPPLVPGEPGSSLAGRLPIAPTWPHPAVEGRVLRTLVFLFEDGGLTEVTASYRADVPFTRMGLEPLYGPPTTVLAPPRRPGPRGAAEGTPLLQIWTWEWEDATLQVTGVHTAGSGPRPSRGPHFFTFHLATRR